MDKVCSISIFPCVYFYDGDLKGLGSLNANRLSFFVCTRNYSLSITITRLCNILQFFTAINSINSDEKCDIFIIFAQNRWWVHVNREY